jgi:hypothetical protein
VPDELLTLFQKKVHGVSLGILAKRDVALAICTAMNHRGENTERAYAVLRKSTVSSPRCQSWHIGETGCRASNLHGDESSR